MYSIVSEATVRFLCSRFLVNEIKRLAYRWMMETPRVSVPVNLSSNWKRVLFQPIEWFTFSRILEELDERYPGFLQQLPEQVRQRGSCSLVEYSLVHEFAILHFSIHRVLRRNVRRVRIRIILEERSASGRLKVWKDSYFRAFLHRLKF